MTADDAGLSTPPATDPTAPKQDTTDPELYHTAGDIDAIRGAYGWSPTVTTNHGYPDGLDVEALFADVPAALKRAVNVGPPIPEQLAATQTPGVDREKLMAQPRHVRLHVLHDLLDSIEAIPSEIVAEIKKLLAA